MQPPGDCEWPRYWVLRNAYKNACKGKLRCKKGQNPKVWPEIKDRLDRCIKAREDLNNECFRGGDQKHYDWIENNLKPWRDECLDLMRQCTPRRR